MKILIKKQCFAHQLLETVKKPTITKRNDILYRSWVYGWTDIQIKKLVNELTKRNNLIANELKNKFEYNENMRIYTHKKLLQHSEERIRRQRRQKKIWANSYISIWWEYYS